MLTIMSFQEQKLFLSSSIPLCKLEIILSAEFDDIYILGVENHSV